MPNHIKNRLEIIGTSEQIQSVLEKFSTSYPASLNVTDSGDDIMCQDKETKQFQGWFNPNTGIYSQRGKEDRIGLPENLEFEIRKAWIHFPDFQKIFPIPEVLKGFNPHRGIISAVKNKYNHPHHSNPLIAGLEAANRIKAPSKFEGKDQETFEKSCKAYEETGYAYWYDWQCNNWGTKWNAYSCEKLSENMFSFETAWSGVPKLIEEISKAFPKIQFNYEYADEDTGSNTGIMKFMGGLVIEEFFPESCSLEGYELAFKLRPEHKEYYKLQDGNYVYIEEE